MSEILIFIQTIAAVLLARKFSPASMAAQSLIIGFARILTAFLAINAVANVAMKRGFDIQQFLLVSIFISALATIGGLALKTAFKKFGLTDREW
jgi:hypothetical protein